MGFFSFLFGGKYPSTSKYEAKMEQAVADFERIQKIASSADYAKYKELGATINSADFKSRVNKLKTEKFSDTEAYKKEQEYKRLRDSSDIKQYLKFKSKQMDQRLTMAKQSSDYVRFMELKETVSTPEFKQLMTQKDFKTRIEYQTYKDYEKLSKSSAVKFVKKTEGSDAYKNYLHIDGSDRLKKMQELEEYINSSEFKQFKAEMEDSRRFKKSAEAQTIREYESLAKDRDIVWYLKSINNQQFTEIAKRKPTLTEEFDKYDTSRWGFGYYWGKALANTTYSLQDERQAFVEKNVRTSNSELTLTTTKEQTKGNRWNPVIGFVSSEFDYSSATINTGNSFRQKFGRFDFKVKMSLSNPVVHNIWMVGEKQVPMINVVTYGADKKSIRVGTVGQNGAKTVTVDGADFSEYHIISLVWTSKQLTWYINGVEVYTQKADVPQEPMYINISSNVSAKVQKSEAQTAQLNVDWIRVYSLED